MTKLFEYGRRAKRSRRRIATSGAATLALASFLALTLAGSSGAAAKAVPLGAGSTFGVLAGAGITNTGPTTINGDIGTFPTTTITGAGSLTLNGSNHAGDGVTQQAKNDLVNAYDNAAGQGPTNPIVADLGGQLLKRGVYNSGATIGLTGTLTLDAEGDPNAVFVFQAGSALTTASASSVSLINGAQACNVFWKVGSSATLGTNSSFVGSVIALSSITVTTGATVVGRVLARNGTVTLDTNRISVPGCVLAPVDTATRTIYCKGGTAYNLIVGQDKQAPYAALGLTAAFVDPVTGALTCTAATPPTTTTTTTTTATTPTATTPTPTGPTAKQIAAAKAKRVAAAKAKQAALARARRLAAAKSTAIAKAKPKPRAATTTTFGFTG